MLGNSYKRLYSVFTCVCEYSSVKEHTVNYATAVHVCEWGHQSKPIITVIIKNTAHYNRKFCFHALKISYFSTHFLFYCYNFNGWDSIANQKAPREDTKTGFRAVPFFILRLNIVR